MSGHSTASLGARHPIHNWEYADATARLAATGFVSGDVKKVALQLDDYTYWTLTATTPTWEPIRGSGLTNPMTTAGDSIVGGLSGVPTRLPLGTALQVRRVNAAGNAEEFADPPAAGGASNPIGYEPAGSVQSLAARLLAASGVTPGSYTAADITVDELGRVTAAANGVGGGGGADILEVQVFS